MRVESQRVIIVKPVDVHFSQVHLIVGVDGGGGEEVACTWRNLVWKQGVDLIQMKKKAALGTNKKSYVNIYIDIKADFSKCMPLVLLRFLNAF